jgi:hypothetical protein
MLYVAYYDLVPIAGPRAGNSWYSAYADIIYIMLNLVPQMVPVVPVLEYLLSLIVHCAQHIKPSNIKALQDIKGRKIGYNLTTDQKVGGSNLPRRARNNKPSGKHVSARRAFWCPFGARSLFFCGARHQCAIKFINSVAIQAL